MPSLNPASDVSAFINTIFEAAILVTRDNTFMPSAVRGFSDRTGLATRKNSQYGGATINQISETDDLTGQAFTPANITTLTPVEFGAQYFITDSRVESDPFSVVNDASADLGGAMATKIETSLMGHFDEFTGGHHWYLRLAHYVVLRHGNGNRFAHRKGPVSLCPGCFTCAMVSAGQGRIRGFDLRQQHPRIPARSGQFDLLRPSGRRCQHLRFNQC